MNKKLLFPALLLLFLVSLACSGNDERDSSPTATATTGSAAAEVTSTATPTATVAPTATPEPTATPRPRPEANRFPPELQAEAEALLEQIVEVRGIPLAEPVDMFLLTREQARAFYSREAPAPPNPPAAGPTPTPAPRPLDLRQELYELLGLIPPQDPDTGVPSIEEQELDNLISIITGFYDHTYRAFYMIETINGGLFGALARSTIIHELVHALQYQEVDINALAAERAGNFDAMTALLSVLEGEAVYTENQILGFSTRAAYRQPVCFGIPTPIRPGTPPAIERELDVWYEDGLCFIEAIVERDPDGIARIWENVPTTMEQILHPEKYLAGEEAIPVELDALERSLGSSWELLGKGVFGEFGLQNVLLTGLANDRQRVQSAAAGWGGDAYRLYVSGDRRLLHLETVWDTQPDAPEFRDALRASLLNQGFSVSVESGPSVRLERGGVIWSLTQRDALVRVLVTNDNAALDAALARWAYE